MGDHTITVKSCDYCGHTPHSPIAIETCLVCGKDFCLSCHLAIGNPFNVALCGKCFAEDPEVKEVMEATTANWRERRAGLVDLLSDWDNKMTRDFTIQGIRIKRRMEEKAAEATPPHGQDGGD